MKKTILPLIILSMLSACTGGSPEEELQSAEDRKEELESMLQTEEVEYQRNTMQLDALEEEISRSETDSGNDDIDEYVEIIDEYASSLETEFTALTELIERSDEEEDMSIITDDIDDIIENVNDTIGQYDEAAAPLELNDSLERQHNEIELANEELPEALETIEDGAEDSSEDGINEGLNMLNEASGYY